MAELETIVAAVRGAIEAAGLKTTAAFPAGGKKRCAVPVAAVGVRAGEGVPSGFAEYMGERFDEASGACFEVYGKRLELTICADVYSPKEDGYGAAGCLAAVGLVLAALPNLPSGVKIRKFTCGETQFDAKTELFLCRTELLCTCFLYADRTGDSELLDFTLKGVLV